ncbi:MAG TPA: ABC transporter ATP-binding protein [Gemmataceae bacterium]|nr:ABC transporter ATP-binding protein [Gemmataceae bacterium]
MPLLNVQNLSVRFELGRQSFHAVDHASFTLEEGRTLALVGESGCGKTSIGLALLRLVPPGATIQADSIAVRGRELTRLTEREICAIRGKDLAMVFQDPLTALNPVYTVGEQIAEGLRLHEKLKRREAWTRAVEAMREVGIPDPAQRAREYPHQLSGGLRQRVTIAQAIACRPALLIADEPTTALDVSLQAQIIDLLLQLQADRRLSILLITHDLGVVAEMAHDVAVMYAGQIVEYADVKSLFARPLHPYTRGLMRSAPGLAENGERRLYSLEGTVPDLARLPAGCRFAPRCPHAVDRCQAPQALREVEPSRLARCCRALETLS